MEARPTGERAGGEEPLDAHDRAAQRERAPAPVGGAPDYYGALGLAPDASAEEIHEAYRRLAKLWHPDRYAVAPPELRARAERRMRAVNAAHAALGDPARRRAYDLARYPAAYAPDPHAPARPAPSPNDGMYWRAPTSASANPNGAGQFLGILCLILALGAAGGALRGGEGATVALFFAICLALLALFFFTDESALAQVARRWAEGEPPGYRTGVQRRQPAQQVPHHTARVAPEPEGPADADAEARAAERFERLVDEALATVPEAFAPHMRNVHVRVERWPSREDLRLGGVPKGHTLLGLYHGVPLTSQGVYGAGPEIITIYRGPIERICGDDPGRIRRQVRATVLHELAHHFGIDHDEMPAWVK